MDSLTKRELEIMDLFTLGLKPHEISQKLSVPCKTVEISVSNIYNLPLKADFFLFILLNIT